MVDCWVMANWSFLTSHARVLMCIAHDPGARLRDIAASLGITERSAYGIVTELAEAGYVIRQKDGRRNRYQIQAHLPLPAAASPPIRPARRAGYSRRDQRRNLPPHAAAAALPSCGPTAKDGQLPAGAARRGGTPFQPSIRSSVPDGAGRSTDVIAIAASAPQ